MKIDQFPLADMWQDLSVFNLPKRKECKTIVADRDTSTPEAQQKYTECMHFLYPESGDIGYAPFIVIMLFMGVVALIISRFYK